MNEQEIEKLRELLDNPNVPEETKKIVEKLLKDNDELHKRLAKEIDDIDNDNDIQEVLSETLLYLQKSKQQRKEHLDRMKSLDRKKKIKKFLKFLSNDES